MRDITRLISFIILLLTAATPIISANSSLQNEATIYSIGTIQYENEPEPDNGDVVFSFDAESGSLQGWDTVTGDGVIQISSEHAHSGTRSIYMYQKAAPKTEQERRCHLRIMGSTLGLKSGTIVYYMYVDSMLLTENDDWGPTLGGWQVWWGPQNEKLYRWWTGGRFGLTQDDKFLTFNYRWGQLDDGIIFSQSARNTQQYFESNLCLFDHVGEWIKLEIQFKIATNNQGYVKAFVNNQQFVNLVGINTDPRAFTEWNSDPVYGRQCVFHSTWSPNGAPEIGPDLYAGENSPAMQLWYDDFTIIQ